MENQIPQNSIKSKLLFVLIVLVLVLPAIQREFRLINEKPLTGAFVEKSKPSFDSLTYQKWYDGTFQSTYNDLIEADIGFRKTLVRISNQLQYKLLRKANAEGVVVGKKAELYEEDYIRAVKGDFFVGEKAWVDKAAMLKKVQDTLENLGKTIVVVFEPGKGSVYPDRYPVGYNKTAKNPSNYKIFSKALDSLNVNKLDLNEFFIQQREQVPYRLFPRIGTHWSYYGAALAADTTLNYLHTLTGFNIPQLKITNLEEKEKPRHPDDDIWLAMNLLYPPPADELIYPTIIHEPSEKSSARILIIGDSFYFNWQSEKIMANAFSDGSFWYYNKHNWNFSGVETGLVKDLNFREQIMKHDIFLIMITERFHHNFAWNFDEQLFELFYPGERDKLEYFANQIRISNLEFMRLLKDAKTRNISLEERLIKEAKYLMFEDYTRSPEKYTRKQDYILMLSMSIESTPEWYEKVKEKAAQNQISVEEMIRLDAEWIYNQKFGGVQ
jgi:hypothetical protein